MTDFMVQKLVKAKKKDPKIAINEKKSSSDSTRNWNVPARLGTFIARLGSAREISAHTLHYYPLPHRFSDLPTALPFARRRRDYFGPFSFRSSFTCHKSHSST